MSTDTLEQLDARVTKLEILVEKTPDRLSGIETGIAVLNRELDLFRSEAFRTFATKSDLHVEINKQTWRFVTWMTTICGVMVAATFYVARTIQ